MKGKPGLGGWMQWVQHQDTTTDRKQLTQGALTMRLHVDCHSQANHATARSHLNYDSTAVSASGVCTTALYMSALPALAPPSSALLTLHWQQMLLLGVLGSHCCACWAAPVAQ